MNKINFLGKNKYKVFSSFIVVLSLVFPYNYSLAEVMGSNTYKIQSDSVNAGSMDSSSATYKIRDTVGEAATGESASANYKIAAGFQQMQEPYLAISSPTDLVLNHIGGLSNQVSEGTMSWQVTTDNLAGYSLSIASSTTPALKSAFDSFADYTPASSDPDYNYINPSTTSSFGFSPEGTEAISRFRDNGSVCNAGGTNKTSGKCWDGLSTTPKAMSGSSTSNHPSGSTATVRLRAENGADHLQSAGDYTVTIVVTAVTL